MSPQFVRRTAIWLSASLLVAGCLVASSFFARRQVAAQGGGGNNFTQEVEACQGDENLDPKTALLYKQLEPLLRNAAAVANNDRCNFYSAYNNGVNWVISGWGAGIIAVRDAGDGDGYFVTLAVNPEFSANADGATCVSGDYTESWYVNPVTGETHYLGFADPEGMAGGPLNEIGA